MPMGQDAQQIYPADAGMATITGEVGVKMQTK